MISIRTEFWQAHGRQPRDTGDQIQGFSNQSSCLFPVLATHLTSAASDLDERKFMSTVPPT
jgi:hypothetical protein